MMQINTVEHCRKDRNTGHRKAQLLFVVLGKPLTDLTQGRQWTTVTEERCSSVRQGQHGAADGRSVTSRVATEYRKIMVNLFGYFLKITPGFVDSYRFH